MNRNRKEATGAAMFTIIPIKPSLWAMFAAA